ncbi:glycoside hydrolase family 97 protein [Asticcacaulis machinosus]|uniref:Glycoside hydrolase family 97 protein n=1 Tax=Asticcacaulis machinosus TaxID=2984211 RepID=A0ABT5HNK7_9CAUL|nr:glycoside hydrolase family 97 protein [Asticcacaulis machinosus]MDC7677818.1 glycoside hydrolase family 97 protein [Asticcacaulis machinosus]
MLSYLKSPSLGLFCAASLLAMTATLARAGTVVTTSPDGRNVIRVETSATGLTYSVSRDGHPIIAPSPLGLRFDAGQIGASAVDVVGQKTITVNTTYTPVVGKASRVADHYNQTRIDLNQPGPVQLNYTLIVRAYDEGVALRYVLPQQPGLPETLKIHQENTQFNFPNDYKCVGSNIGRYDSSSEAEFDPVKASKIRGSNRFMAPLVCKTGVENTTFAIAESDVRNYPGAYYAGRDDGGLGLATVLPPRFDSDRDLRFKSSVLATLSLKDGSAQTPWRVVMLGDTPGSLVASNLIPTLAEPSTLTDTSWIKAGKSAWDWWSHWTIDVPGAKAGINTATYKAYIDFAVAMKLEYILIDEGWSVGSSVEPTNNSDVTRAIPAVDMPDILKYAKSKGVGVWVWVQWKQLDAQMDQALAQYQAWGIKGIKVDFLDRNDQEMVDYYHKLLSKAAEHHIMVNLHGAYPPNGLARTYPNYVTQEGVMGAEYNKGTTRITATHNVTLPFTRMILGPIDYTPGGFRHLTPEAFAIQKRNSAPFVQTTRGQAVAMYVVYDSPFVTVADSPEVYKKADGSWADGAEFIRDVPATWDETRVLSGDIGQYIVTARRSGKTWYIGVMGNEDPRDLSVPLSFLGKGRFKARIHQDGADISSLSVSDQAVTADVTLNLKLAASGGAVVVLTPTK